METPEKQQIGKSHCQVITDADYEKAEMDLLRD